MQQIDRILDRAARTGIVPLLQGSPGIGKTAAVNAYAPKLEARLRGPKVQVFTLILSQKDPTEVAGIPMPGADRIRYEPDPVFREAFDWCAAGNIAIIFLDELTTCPPSVQAAALTPFQTREFGDIKIPLARSIMVAACNPPDEAAAGYELSAPAANRFAHYEIAIDTDGFLESYPLYWGNPPALDFETGRTSPEGYARARSNVAAYIKQFRNSLFTLPKDATKRGGAWPSPRSWDMAARALAVTYDDHASHTEALQDIQGCVGEGEAIQFVSYLTDLDLPDPEALIANPGSFVMPDRGDKVFAVITSVTAAVVANTTPDRWLAGWEILGKVAETKPDMGAISAMDLANARKGRPANAPPLPNPGRDALKHYAPILAAVKEPA